MKPENYVIRLCLLLMFLFMASVSPSGAGENAENGKPLKTALTGKFPPFSFYDNKGELAGFDVDMSREIAKRIGRKSEIIATEWDGILAGLLAGKYDAIVGSMAITPERQQQVNFTAPYYYSGAQLFVHRDNPKRLYSIDDCAKARIAVVLGETYQHFLETNYPEVEVVTLKSGAEIFEMLSQKRIDGFVTDKLVGSWQIQKAGRDFVAVGDLLYKESIAIPVRKDNPELLEAINDALAGIESDGTLKKIHDKYFSLSSGRKTGNSGELSNSIIAEKLLAGFGITLIIAVASIALGFILSIPCGVILTYPKAMASLPYMVVRTIVDFLRGTPVLIQLLFVWMGMGLTPFKAAILTLGINSMAYMSEVIRAGLMSVDPGQALAAQALGLTKLQRFRHVIWPQAFRIAIPPLMNSVVALIKDTALVAVISIPEVIREAQSIISITFEPGKYYMVVAVMFFVVTFPLMKMAGLLEKRIKQKGFAHD
ncbi:MAG: ABC transporter substrate-binding protein/permease [Planctomycetes bacterium]|nr:ABC transporter substrate-binding protein/permease [Planctomycetota bacterium]